MTKDKSQSIDEADAKAEQELAAATAVVAQSARDMLGSNPNIPPGPRMESLGGRVLESINEPPEKEPKKETKKEKHEEHEEHPDPKHRRHL